MYLYRGRPGASTTMVKYPTKYAVFLLYAAIETTAHPQRAE